MAADRMTKPGSCPALDGQSNSTGCGVPCSSDMECQGADKCCPGVEGCGGEAGQQCVPPFNLSLCLQQQQIAQLLSLTEREGKGYVPQCDEDGQKFAARQCSRNGLVCWCVDPELGTKVKGSMGSAGDVVCDGLCKWIRFLLIDLIISKLNFRFCLVAEQQPMPWPGRRPGAARPSAARPATTDSRRTATDAPPANATTLASSWPARKARRAS